MCFGQVFVELADAQAAAASSMSELAELRRQNKELQKQVRMLTRHLGCICDQNCLETSVRHHQALGSTALAAWESE